MKHILVHLDASPRSAVRLAFAQALATRHEARLTALYGVVPGLLASPWGTGDGLVAMARELLELDVQQRERAEALVRQAASRDGQVSPVWVDAGSSPYWTMLQQAPYADLLVLGQDNREDTLTGPRPPDLVPGTLCESGRPTLLIPDAGQFPTEVRRALVAWKPSREAARALAASLPWLLRAEHIDVALRPEEGVEGFDHAQSLKQWLQWQGVRAEVRLHRPGPGDIGEALLSLAADADADLLVMGCYGHSRAREWVMGGATQSILRAMTLPVLMSH